MTPDETKITGLLDKCLRNNDQLEGYVMMAFCRELSFTLLTRRYRFCHRTQFYYFSSEHRSTFPDFFVLYISVICSSPLLFHL
jgi:hypothetical protein